MRHRLSNCGIAPSGGNVAGHGFAVLGGIARAHCGIAFSSGNVAVHSFAILGGIAHSLIAASLPQVRMLVLAATWLYGHSFAVVGGIAKPVRYALG